MAGGAVRVMTEVRRACGVVIPPFCERQVLLVLGDRGVDRLGVPVERVEGVRSPCAREDAAAELPTLLHGPFRRVVPVGGGDAAGALHVRQLFLRSFRWVILGVLSNPENGTQKQRESSQRVRLWPAEGVLGGLGVRAIPG